MIHNLLLGSFVDIDDSIDFYQRHYLPIEQLADTMVHSTGRKFEAVMQEIFECFLSSKEYGQNLSQYFVGGKMKSEVPTRSGISKLCGGCSAQYWQAHTRICN